MFEQALKPFTAAILTVSDTRAQGKGMDTSGDFLEKALTEAGYQVKALDIVPDDQNAIQSFIRYYADRKGIDLVVTSGGTGFSPRDTTPEATLKVLHRPVPGISEALRMKGLEKTAFAVLSRGIAGIRYKTLIINLPGSLKAVKEGFEVIRPVLSHALEKLHGDQTPCGE